MGLVLEMSLTLNSRSSGRRRLRAIEQRSVLPFAGGLFRKMRSMPADISSSVFCSPFSRDGTVTRAERNTREYRGIEKSPALESTVWWK